MNDKASRRSERVQLRISWARRISRCTAVITLNCSARQGRCAKEVCVGEIFKFGRICIHNLAGAFNRSTLQITIVICSCLHAN
jgi:hypothetical protein